MNEPGLGTSIALIRQTLALTQDDVAVLMRAHGVGWRREQVVRVERGQRQVTAHVLYVLARVLGVPLHLLYRWAGYPDSDTVAGTPQGSALWQRGETTYVTPYPESARRIAESVRHDLSAAAQALLVDSDVEALLAVTNVHGAWRNYEQKSGRPPTERASRAKLASLWAEYEQDPGAFRARAANGGTHE